MCPPSFETGCVWQYEVLENDKKVTKCMDNANTGKLSMQVYEKENIFEWN